MRTPKQRLPESAATPLSRVLPLPLKLRRPPRAPPLHEQAQQEQAYVDMAVCEEEREKGNAAFKENRYPEAVAHYQESLKR